MTAAIRKRPFERGAREHSAQNGLALAALGVLACLIVLATALLTPQEAMRAWLAAAFFWSSLPIGALLLLMMMRLIPGAWSNEAMLVMEAGSLLAPLGALAFVPVLIGMKALYPWFGQTQDTAFRQIYFAPAFFALRTVLWFVLLWGLSWLLIHRRRWSVPVSCAGLIVLPLAGTVIATDWLMSLDPEFRSSGFGLYALSVQTSIAMVAGGAVALVLSQDAIRKPAVLGGLMLCVLLLWAYFSYMQYVVIWSSDFPKLIRWYQDRAQGVWLVVLWSFALLHTLVLGLLILPPVLARSRLLMALASIALAGKFLEAGWIVLPSRDPLAGGLELALFVIASAGLGAIFLPAGRAAIRARLVARSPKPTRGGAHG